MLMVSPCVLISAIYVQPSLLQVGEYSVQMITSGLIFLKFLAVMLSVM